MNKTISYLNSKSWYRGFKVGVIIIAILFFIFFEIALFEDLRTYSNNYSLSTVICHNGPRYNIVKSDYGFDKLTISEDSKKRVALEICKSSYESLADRVKSFPSLSKYGTPISTTDQYLEINNVYSASYFVKISQIEEGKFTFYTICLIILMLTILEVLKRVFYYIVLGSFTPPEF